LNEDVLDGLRSIHIQISFQEMVLKHRWSVFNIHLHLNVPDSLMFIHLDNNNRRVYALIHLRVTEQHCK